MIVETHVHIASPDQKKYPRLPEAAGWGPEQEVSAEGLLQMMEGAGIDKAVLTQRNRAYRFDNSYIADAALQHPKRFASLGMLDPLTDDACDRLTYWVRERGMHSLRLYLTEPGTPPLWLEDPRTIAVIQRAEHLSIPVCILAHFDQFGSLRKVLERFTRLRIALEHLGLPDLKEGPPYRSSEPLFKLAKASSNLYLKFSSPNVYASAEGRSTPREFFSRLVDHFGAPRIMWGSNFPRTVDRPLKAQLELAKESLSFLLSEEQRFIFGETALNFWPTLR
jgi:predicted TIM-barrel fold metal-dependent hydrolase